MAEDAAAARLRADLAQEILAWMNDAFTGVGFDGPSDKVIEGLTLAWSAVLLRIEAIDQTDAQWLLGAVQPPTTAPNSRREEFQRHA